MIEIIYGPVRSGKTTLMMARIERAALAGKKCLVVKHVIDDRYDNINKNAIVTNAFREYFEGFEITRASKIAEIAPLVKKYDVVGITESQFFEDITYVGDLADENLDIKFICEGLDGCFRRNAFGKVASLIPKCDKVKKLNAVCYKCGADAPFSTKLVAGEETIDVGGADKYAPSCRRCFIAGI